MVVQNYGFIVTSRTEHAFDKSKSGNTDYTFSWSITAFGRMTRAAG